MANLPESRGNPTSWSKDEGLLPNLWDEKTSRDLHLPLAEARQLLQAVSPSCGSSNAGVKTGPEVDPRLSLLSTASGSTATGSFSAPSADFGFPSMGDLALRVPPDVPRNLSTQGQQQQQLQSLCLRAAASLLERPDAVPLRSPSRLSSDVKTRRRRSSASAAACLESLEEDKARNAFAAAAAALGCGDFDTSGSALVQGGTSLDAALPLRVLSVPSAFESLEANAGRSLSPRDGAFSGGPPQAAQAARLPALNESASGLQDPSDITEMLLACLRGLDIHDASQSAADHRPLERRAEPVAESLLEAQQQLYSLNQLLQSPRTSSLLSQQPSVAPQCNSSSMTSSSQRKPVSAAPLPQPPSASLLFSQLQTTQDCDASVYSAVRAIQQQLQACQTQQLLLMHQHQLQQLQQQQQQQLQQLASSAAQLAPKNFPSQLPSDDWQPPLPGTAKAEFLQPRCLGGAEGVDKKTGLSATAASEPARRRATVGEGAQRNRRERRGDQHRLSLPLCLDAAALEALPLAANSPPLLRQCREGRRSFTAEELATHVGDFAADGVGVRVLLETLDSASAAERHKLVLSALPYAVKLSTHPAGNFVVRKMFELGTCAEKHSLLTQLLPYTEKLSLDTFGCRVIQKAFEEVSEVEKLTLSRRLRHCVLTCIADQNGNHVIQKCISSLPKGESQFVLDAIRGKEATLAANCYGCRIIQRLTESCDAQQARPMLDAVMASLPALTEDQFGNYVVQHLLEFGRREDKEKILELLRSNFCSLASQKYACNVVERALGLNTLGHAQETLIDVALASDERGTVPLVHLMLDRYGNYVVQRMIEVSRGLQRHLLLALLLNELPVLLACSYGRHVVGALERLEDPCKQTISALISAATEKLQQTHSADARLQKSNGQQQQQPSSKSKGRHKSKHKSKLHQQRQTPSTQAQLHTSQQQQQLLDERKTSSSMRGEAGARQHQPLKEKEKERRHKTKTASSRSRENGNANAESAYSQGQPKAGEEHSHREAP